MRIDPVVFLDAVPYGVIAADANNRVIYCNKAAQGILGYSENEMLSMTIADFHQTPEAFRLFLRELQERHQVYEREFTWITKRGEPITVSLSSWAVRDAGYQCIFRDTTADSKHFAILDAIAATVSRSLDLEEVLRTALDKVLSTVAMEAGGVYLLNEETQEMMLQVHRGLSADFVSRVERMKIGIKGFVRSPLRTGKLLIVEDVSKDPIIRSVIPAEEGIRSLAVVLLKSKDKIWGTMNLASRRYRHFDADEIRLLESIGNQIGVAIENARLYQKIRQSEENYRVLFEHSGTAVAIADEDGTLAMVNKRFEELSGYSKEEIVGKISSFEFVAPEDRDRIFCYHQQRIRDPHSAPSNYEYTFINRNGERRTVNQTVNFIPGTTKKIVSITDVTKQKELQRKFLESQQLATIGELVAAIAHEIKNPLGAINTSVAVLMNELRLSGENGELFRIIVDESTRLNAIIDDFLRFARPPKPKFKPTDINSLLRETLLFMRDKFGEKTLVEENLAGNVPLILVDPNQIRQVFINLILNAIEAMPDGGKLIVSTTVAEDQKSIHFVVEDTGHGIEADKLSKIFQPFYSTKEKGTGMGLAISQSIIRSHGGKIWAESGSDRGAKFTVMLPIHGRG